MKKVGLITIGQSPRDDVVPDIKLVLEGVEVFECGALDDLSKIEIEALTPREGEYILVTRLRDGTEVKVSREKILPLMQKCIDKLEQVADVIGLLCTGDFPELRSKKILIEPSKLLLNIVSAFNIKKLGVIVPDPRQVDTVAKRWYRVIEDVVVDSFSPYTGDIKKLPEIAKKFSDRDLIILDCIGYSIEVKRIFMEITKKPVVLPRTILARILRELTEVV
jgi:protein AroM